MTQTPVKTQQMQVGGMDCASCGLKIEKAVQKLSGVVEVAVSAATGRLSVSYNPQQVSEAEIRDRVTALGYTLLPPQTSAAQQSHHAPTHTHDHTHTHGEHHLNRHGDAAFSRKQLASILTVVALLVLGMVFEEWLHSQPYRFVEYAIFIPAYLLSGWSVLKTAGRNLLRGQVLDENFLMTVATLGAIAIHKLPEAVSVMLFYKIGELFQEAAVSRSRRSIQSLLAIRPDVANLKTESGIQALPPEKVQVGEVILVKPGEKIALDGEVLAGQAMIDTSALTGESVPRSVQVGDTVLAGTINQTGVLTVRVTKPFAESSIARILELVENASSKKATAEKFITRFAQQYTPVVVILSLAVALLPPFFLANATHTEWVYRGLTLLVISCPCGLVISIPLGYFGGVGSAAKRGILVKGSTFLDTLAQVKAVVFDKTGTLTEGVFQVTQIVAANGFQQSDVLQWAAAAESGSNHPIAQSIQQANPQPTQLEATEYTEIAGLGIRATINQSIILVGNQRLLHQEGIEYSIEYSSVNPGTVVHVAVDGVYAGYLTIADQLKPDAAAAVQALKQLGVSTVIMLTGDSKTVAEQVAHSIGLDSYQAELLPEDKVAALEAVIAANSGKVAFVGDGINDAPVIARADVGMAMGFGSDAAIETADVVIMTDAPAKVAEAIQIGRKTRQIVWQNIILAMAIKGLFILLGIFGVATLWEAVFADVGVALLAVLNATRVLK